MRRIILLVAAALAVAAVGCSEPEPSSYALVVSTTGGGEVCGQGPEHDALCFDAAVLDLPDGVELHVDDCIGVEVSPPGSDDVVRGWWDGRCADRTVSLGVTSRDGRTLVLIPECLGSLTSISVTDEAGETVWSAYREVSTEHPLLTYVELGVEPPGFAEGHPLETPEAAQALTATATQQLDLPAATVTFEPAELDEGIVAGDARYATEEEYLAAAGCAPAT